MLCKKLSRRCAQASRYLTKTCFPILAFFQLLCGCNGSKQIYYWKGYSESLYAFEKIPNKKNRLKYKETLNNIIGMSRKKGKRVPPGVFAEYGYRIAQEGKVSEAATYFDMEEKNYPESAVFVRHLRERFR